MKKVLEGVKVVDFSLAASAPICSKILSEYGAEVIIVESLTGSTTRTGAPNSFDFFTSGKREISVNLKTPEGMEIMRSLIKEADVFQSNFRAKALKKLGLSYEDVHKLNPGCVYAVVDGFGNKGPEKDDPGYDVISFWAKGGLQRDMSPRGVLMPSPVTVGDTATGIALVGGICAALYGKKMTGEGTYVSSSLLSAALFLNNDCYIETQYGDIYPRSHETSRRAMMNTYRCKDGEWVSILSVSFDRDFNNLLKALGREDLVGDPRWTCIEDTMYEKAPELIKIFDEAFAKMTRDEAIERLKPIDIGLCAVQSTKDTMTDPQVLANQFIVEYETLEGKKVFVPTPPCRVGEDYEPVQMQLGPKLGEHTVEILKELGYSQEKIDELLEKQVIKAAE